MSVFDRDDDEELEDREESEEETDEASEEEDSEEQAEEGGSEEDESTDEEGDTSDAGAQSQKKVPIKALHEARREKKALRDENQALKRRLDEMEARVNAATQPGGKAATTKAKFKIDAEKLYADPDAVFEAFETHFENQRQATKIAESIEDAREEFQDYDLVIKDFDTWAAANPQKAERAMRSRSPATFVYKDIVRWRKEAAASRDDDAVLELKRQNEELLKRLDAIEGKKGKPKPPKKLASTRGTRPESRSTAADDSPFSKW